MRRREFLWLLGSGFAVGYPCAVRAQKIGKIYHVAIVMSAGPVSRISETGHPNYRAFLGELRRLGYVEGQNIIIERYSAEGHPERYHQLVRDVVSSNPDAVLIYTLSFAQEFKAQTTAIPIVAQVIDPVEVGFVPSIARPGGNITGSYAAPEIWGKRLGLLKEAIPKLSRVGLLVAPTLVARRGTAMLEEASAKLGVSLFGAPIESPFDEAAYSRAFVAIVQGGAEAVYLGDQLESWTAMPLIIELAQKHRMPTIYPMPEAIAAGGFMIYAIDYTESFRHSAQTIDKIFNGTNPGDIPFYQNTKFDLLINLKTANALGIEIAPNLLAQADEVIE